MHFEIKACLVKVFIIYFYFAQIYQDFFKFMEQKLSLTHLFSVVSYNESTTSHCSIYVK